MLRNRPLAPPAPADHGIASTPTTPASASRLHVLPVASPAPPQRPSLGSDLLRLGTHRLSAFLAEAAVLVLVLGILERFLAAHRVELPWVGLILAISATLLGGSIALELTGTRRAGHS